jgi:hypothetical protein
MKKLSAIFGILLLTAGSVWSQQSINVPVVIQENGGLNDGPRSVVFAPTVTLDGAELTFDFSSATASQIVLMDENNNCQVVYSEDFASTTQVVVDLQDEGIGEGRYLLWLFAFGQWWEGEFVLTEDNNNE